MKKILVTGGAGFIGSKICKRFIDKNYEVFTIDNLSTGKKSNIPEGVIFFKGNCQDIEIIKKLFKFNFDAIFHIAGQSSGEISFDNPVYDLESNTTSTLNLLELAKKINCKKFFYASSMSVYGNKISSTTEKAMLSPNSFYGVGKFASEHYLRLFSKRGVNCTSFRMFNVYGPGQNLENLRQGMVSIFISQAHNNNKIIIKGSLKRYRDFIYIDDVVNAFEISYLKDLAGYNCYNLCTNKKTSVGELIKKIKQYFNPDLKIEVNGSTDGDINGIVGDNSKIKKELNWIPKVNLKDGIEIMCKSLENAK